MIARDSTGDTLPVAGFQPDEGGPAGDVEIWRLTEPSLNSIDGARRLREFADEEEVETFNGPALVLPAVSPHHVAILSARAGGCPAGPPHPAPPDSSFVEPPRADLFPEVTVLDSGYIHIKPPYPPHVRLDERVTLVDGEWLDTLTHPPSWLPDRPDGLYTDADGRLDGISGHGTFIAGLIAHIAPEAKLKVVGLRNQEVLIAGQSPVEQLGLFETEIAIAHAMLAHCDTDVMQCGFAFPTLDDYPSLPFAAAMQVLTGPEAPREGIAVVAPAGNEESIRRYWPAALPDVIGVASTNAADEARAWFSNWGQWCDCCARGERVFSTFIYWDGPIEGEPLSDDEKFMRLGQMGRHVVRRPKGLGRDREARGRQSRTAPDRCLDAARSRELRTHRHGPLGTSGRAASPPAPGLNGGIKLIHGSRSVDPRRERRGREQPGARSSTVSPGWCGPPRVRTGFRALTQRTSHRLPGCAWSRTSTGSRIPSGSAPGSQPPPAMNAFA